MVKVEIKIWAKPTTDTYARRFGLTIDETLPPDFYITKPEAKIKHPATGEDFITDAEFTLTLEREVAVGDHTIVFAPSSPTGYYWEAELFINDKSLGKQINICKESPYYTEFTVAPGMAEVMSGLVGTMMGLMMMVLMISLMMGIIKRIRRPRGVIY